MKIKCRNTCKVSVGKGVFSLMWPSRFFLFVIRVYFLPVTAHFFYPFTKSFLKVSDFTLMSLIHLTLLIFFYTRCDVETQFPFFAPLSRTVYCLMQLLPNDLQCHLFMQQASCICVCFSIFFYLPLNNRKSCSISGAIPYSRKSEHLW